MTTLPRLALALPFVCSLSLAIGCGLPPDSDVADSDGAGADIATRTQAVVTGEGITVQATYQEVITGTPTYGDPATTPMLRVHVEVDDTTIRRSHPGFDGFERAFVRVPKLSGGRLGWDSVTLRYSGQTRRGYYADIPIDLHDSDNIWNVDWATLAKHGVAVGLDTNVGVVWAQDTDHNFPVTRK